MLYLSLFLSSLVAATLFPVSSEALLLTLLYQGYSPLCLWLVATLGNTLGSCVNWYLGLKLRYFKDKPWFPFSGASLLKAQQHFNRFGRWSLLFSWLPIVGDPLTLVAGMLNVRFSVFVFLVLLGKASRYLVLIWLGGALLE